MYILISMNKGAKKYGTFKTACCRGTLNSWYEWANAYMNDHLNDEAQVNIERENGTEYWQDPISIKDVKNVSTNMEIVPLETLCELSWN